jgi:hypothetical protein
MMNRKHITALRRLSFSIFLFALVVLAASVSGAQAQADSDITISLSPLSPAPGDTVTMTVESPFIDTNDSTITWYENGNIIAQGNGQTTASIVAGALGHASDITVSLVAPDGETASTEIEIAPTEVDLLVDSDSYVPPFYLGRALPSAGTNLRLQAIAHLKRPDGTFVPSSDITYTWKQDGRVVGNVSGRGKSSAVLPAPVLYGTTDIEVNAQSDDPSDSSLSGSASLSIPATTPVLALYQDNPLLGITYYDTLASQASVSDSEATFAAVPYFAQIRSPNDPRLIYAWTVNGASVAAGANDPSELTLNSSGSSNQAQIGLGLTHSTNIFLSVNGTWNITLGQASGSGNGLNTGSSGTKNPFSGQ